MLYHGNIALIASLEDVYGALQIGAGYTMTDVDSATLEDLLGETLQLEDYGYAPVLPHTTTELEHFMGQLRDIDSKIIVTAPIDLDFQTYDQYVANLQLGEELDELWMHVHLVSDKIQETILADFRTVSSPSDMHSYIAKVCYTRKFQAQELFTKYLHDSEIAADAHKQPMALLSLLKQTSEERYSVKRCRAILERAENVATIILISENRLPIEIFLEDNFVYTDTKTVKMMTACAEMIDKCYRTTGGRSGQVRNVVWER